MIKTSIAMATYNGASFIEEQLWSFANQTIKPDELIITDDGSTDDTVDIVHAFAKHAPFEIIIERNRDNLGYSQNFAKAMSLCSGEVVFLSDQDDVWLPTKLEIVLQNFVKNPWAQVVLNDMTICDENLNPSKFTQLQSILSAGARPEAFYSGCCMAVRRSFLQLFFPLPQALFAHDSWLNHLCVPLNVRLLLPEPLQKYRRHGRNASNWILSDVRGVSKLTVLRSALLWPASEGWRDQIYRYDTTLGRLASNKELLESLKLGDSYSDAVISIGNRIENLGLRLKAAELHRTYRWLAILALLKRGVYSDSSGWKSAVIDAIRP